MKMIRCQTVISRDGIIDDSSFARHAISCSEKRIAKTITEILTRKGLRKSDSLHAICR